MEGRVQSFEAAVCPPGDAKPDWQILGLLFAKLGYSKAYSSLDEIRAEIAELVPLYSGLDSDKEEFWITESSALRLFRSAGEGKPIHFSPVSATETGSLDKNYPFKAIFGSRRYHLGSGTRTGHSARIRDFALKGEVEVSPEDFERLDLKKGDLVRISSIHGSIFREVILKKDLSPGFIFIPLAFDNNDAVDLIDFAEMGQVDSPGWKECDVRIEKASS
jgi:predicted molibdopterin-dependent oxidoreductase YjgC